VSSSSLPASRPAPSPTPSIVLPQEISSAFVAEILQPYRDNAKYLKSAQITHLRDEAVNDGPLVVGQGRFAIPQSCYIDDTGHFNAVEFNICFNQLAYVVFGHCIASGALQRLIPGWDQRVSLSYADYKRHQLPSMLIAKLEGRFSRQLKSDDFTGQLTVNRITGAKGAFFCFTSIAFSDNLGGKSHGAVVLAFSPQNVDAPNAA
jgi:hypothetical protein